MPQTSVSNANELYAVASALSTTFQRFIDHVARQVDEGCGIEADQFPQISIRLDDIALILVRIRRQYLIHRTDMGFLDVGCGVGAVLNVAHQMGFWVRGIEYNCNYRILHSDPDAVEWNDVFNVKPKFFKKFNIIYSYRPFKDYKLNQKMFRKLFRAAKVGTIFIIPDVSYIWPRHKAESADFKKYNIVQDDTLTVPYSYIHVFIKQEKQNEDAR